MREAIRQSALKSDVATDILLTLDERQEMYNDVMLKVTDVQQDCSVSKQRMK